MITKHYAFYKVLLVVLFVFTACKKHKKPIKQTEILFKKEAELTIYKSDSTQVHLDIEIAKTSFEIETGLMYRDHMETNEGMLFVFDDVAPRNFYMKNTKIPLDLIFIDASKKIVSFQKNAKPLDESSLPSVVPAKYVLEINAGLVEKWVVSIGDSIGYK